MRNLLTLLGFIIVGYLLFVIWGNLNTKLVAIESNTGSYRTIGPAEYDIGADADVDALLARLTRLEAAQAENARAIADIRDRLDRLPRPGCVGPDCAGQVRHREMISFDHDDATLSPTEMNKIDRLLEDIDPGAIVSLRGYADTSGDPGYNQRLSLRRAAAVKAYIERRLNASGRVDDLLVSITAIGEESAIKPTGDDVRDPSNRVVEILVYQ